MDTSLKYLDMCRVHNIQRNWKFELGDYFGYLADATWRDKTRTHGVSIVDESLLDSKERYTHWVWLPRQDQLQEMITGDEYLYRTEFDNSSVALIETITELARREDNGKSFEMLWLMLVMERKFKKFWSGSMWRNLDNDKHVCMTNFVAPENISMSVFRRDRCIGGIELCKGDVVGYFKRSRSARQQNKPQIGAAKSNEVI